MGICEKKTKKNTLYVQRKRVKLCPCPSPPPSDELPRPPSLADSWVHINTHGILLVIINVYSTGMSNKMSYAIAYERTCTKQPHNQQQQQHDCWKNKATIVVKRNCLVPFSYPTYCTVPWFNASTVQQTPQKNLPPPPLLLTVSLST